MTGTNLNPAVRKPAVAGTFYPGVCRELSGYIDNFKTIKPKTDLKGKKIIGGIVPHAGYQFSGKHAAHFFNLFIHLKTGYDTIIVLHPNHTGYGPEVSVDEHSYWETPLGKIEVDRQLAKTTGFAISDTAQKYEHSCEVIVPFIQHYFHHETKLLPVNILDQSLNSATTTAQKLYECVKKLKKNVLVVASSDFSHFITPDQAEKEDFLIFEQILNKNSRQLYELVKDKQLSVCGFGPIMSLMEYSKMTDSKYNATLLSKGHSGDVIPSDSVVSYASFAFYINQYG